MEAADTWILPSFFGIWALILMLVLAISATWIAWAFTRSRSITVPLVTALTPLIPLAVLAYAVMTAPLRRGSLPVSAIA